MSKEELLLLLIKIFELEKENKRLRSKIVEECWKPNTEVITDDWGYTRTVVHEMGQ